jgi:hypothetical protein
MAKCIQVLGTVLRMSDDDAFQFVERDRVGEYIAKKQWRDGKPAYAKLVNGEITKVETLARCLQHARAKGDEGPKKRNRAPTWRAVK